MFIFKYFFKIYRIKEGYRCIKIELLYYVSFFKILSKGRFSIYLAILLGLSGVLSTSVKAEGIDDEKSLSNLDYLEIRENMNDLI